MNSHDKTRDSRIPGSIGAFTVFGVPVRFHFTFLLLAIFIVFIGMESPETAFADIGFVAGLFGSVILHELGHALVARRYGVKTLEIVMFPIGGVARMDRMPRARKELWIAIAGPAVNLVIATIILGTLAAIPGTDIAGVDKLADPSDANLLERIAYGNLILAVFNLLPAFPMDGGRILRSLLAIWRTEEDATRIASRAGRFLAIGMGLYGLLSTQYMLLFIAFFVYLGATQEGQSAIGRSLTQGLPVRSAMVTLFHTVSHGNTVGDAAQLSLDTGQQDFPVVHGDSVVGLLDRNALLRAMSSEGPNAYVAGVMDRDYTKVSPDLDLAEAMSLLANSGPCALVMDGDRLLGVLNRETLSSFVVLRRMGLSPDVHR